MNCTELISGFLNSEKEPMLVHYITFPALLNFFACKNRCNCMINFISVHNTGQISEIKNFKSIETKKKIIFYKLYNISG